jgi:hypothetical protein
VQQAKALQTGQMMLVTAAVAALLLLWATTAQRRLRQLLRLQVLQCRRCRQVLCLLQLSAEWLLTRQTRQTHHSHQQQLSLIRRRKSRSTAQLPQALLLKVQLAVLSQTIPRTHQAQAFWRSCCLTRQMCHHL